MSTPHDRDRPDDDDAWQEPEHLSGDEARGEEPGGEEPNFADRRKTPRDGDHTAEGATWQPPGWDLPPAGTPVQAHQPPARRGLFGSRRNRDPETARAFTYEGDVVGAQGWALQRGWTISDGSGPEDAELRGLVDSAPVRLTKDHRPASVLRGRSGPLDLVAFDVVYASGRYLVPEYAVTAAPFLGGLPVFRLSPARLWKHGIAGMLPIASGDEAFDARWMLLAGEDSPQIRRLAQDPAVHGLLLGTDDGDEFWSGGVRGGGGAGGYVAAIRPDGHRPALIEHHSRLLTTVVQALAAGA